MRTTARLLTGTASALLPFCALVAVAAPVAYAGDHEEDRTGNHEAEDRTWKHEGLEVFPSTASPGTRIAVNTTACGKNGHGVGEVHGLDAGRFQLAPSTHKEVVAGQFTVPHHAEGGTHRITVECDNGKRASGELVVRHHGPSGHVSTGVGGSVGPDTTQIAAGVAVLAAAAVGGTWLLRRRASGAQGR